MKRQNDTCVYGVALSALLLTPFLHAANTPAIPAHFETYSGTGWTIADFDGDGRPDLVTARPEIAIHGFRHQVRIQLSSSTESVIAFSVDGVSPGLPGIQVSPRDVDGDRDVDLVFTNAVSHDAIGVWINDGSGRFTRGSSVISDALPQALRATRSFRSPGFSGQLAFLPRPPTPSLAVAPGATLPLDELGACSDLPHSARDSRILGARRTRAPPAAL